VRNINTSQLKDITRTADGNERQLFFHISKDLNSKRKNKILVSPAELKAIAVKVRAIPHKGHTMISEQLKIAAEKQLAMEEHVGKTIEKLFPDNKKYLGKVLKW